MLNKLCKEAGKLRRSLSKYLNGRDHRLYWFQKGFLASINYPWDQEEIQVLKDQKNQAIISLAPLHEEVKSEIRTSGMDHLSIPFNCSCLTCSRQVGLFLGFMTAQKMKGNKVAIHGLGGKLNSKVKMMIALYFLHCGIVYEEALERVGGLQFSDQSEILAMLSSFAAKCSEKISP